MIFDDGSRETVMLPIVAIGSGKVVCDGSACEAAGMLGAVGVAAAAMLGSTTTCGLDLEAAASVDTGALEGPTESLGSAEWIPTGSADT